MEDPQYSLPPSSPKQILGIMNILHLALTGSVIMMSIVFFSLAQETPQLQLAQIFLIVSVGLCLSGILVGNFISNAQLAGVRNKKSLLEKLRAYQSVFIIKMALLEGPAIFCVIAYFLTGNIYFFGGVVTMVAFMWLNRPAADKIATDLELTTDERTELE